MTNGREGAAPPGWDQVADPDLAMLLNDGVAGNPELLASLRLMCIRDLLEVLNTDVALKRLKQADQTERSILLRRLNLPTGGLPSTSSTNHLLSKARSGGAETARMAALLFGGEVLASVFGSKKFQEISDLESRAELYDPVLVALAAICYQELNQSHLPTLNSWIFIRTAEIVGHQRWLVAKEQAAASDSHAATSTSTAKLPTDEIRALLADRDAISKSLQIIATRATSFDEGLDDLSDIEAELDQVLGWHNKSQRVLNQLRLIQPEGKWPAVDLLAFKSAIELAEEERRLLDVLSELEHLVGPEYVMREIDFVHQEAKAVRSDKNRRASNPDYSAADTLTLLRDAISMAAEGRKLDVYAAFREIAAGYADLGLLSGPCEQGELLITALPATTESGAEEGDSPLYDAAEPRLPESPAGDNSIPPPQSDEGYAAAREIKGLSPALKEQQVELLETLNDGSAITTSPQLPETETRTEPSTELLTEPAVGTAGNGLDSEPAAMTGAGTHVDVAETSIDPLWSVDEALVHGEASRAWLLSSYLRAPNEVRSAIRAAIFASEMRNATGGCASAFAAEATEILSTGLPSDPALKRLVYAAALRATLIAPYSAAPDLLERLGSGSSDYSDLADAAVSAARQGLTLIDDVLSSAAELSDLEQRVFLASKAAKQFAVEAASRTIKYIPATKIWQKLIAPNRYVGELVSIAATPTWPDNKSRSDAARRLSQGTIHLRSERELHRAIDNVDSRGNKRREIDYGARNDLASLWNEALDVADQWAKAVLALDDASRGDKGSWQQVLLKEVRTKFEASGLLAHENAPLGAALGIWNEAQRLLESTGRLLRGDQPAGVEPPPNKALNRYAVLCAGTRINADWSLDEEHEPPAWRMGRDHGPTLNSPEHIRAALKERLKVDDFVEARLAVELLEDAGATDGEALRESIDKELADARRRVREQWQKVNDTVSGYRRDGFFEEETWRSFAKELNELLPSDGRADMGKIASDLAKVQDSAGRERDRRLVEFNQALDKLSIDESARARIEECLRIRDLATAEEFLALTLEGQPIPDVADKDSVSLGIDPCFDEDLAEHKGLPKKLTNSIKARETFCHLDFKDLSDSDIDELTSTIRAWREGFAAVSTYGATTDWNQILRVPLGAIGLTYSKIERRRSGQLKSDHVWLDLVQVSHAVNSPIPAFGSQAGQLRNQAVLIVKEIRDPHTLSGLIEQDRHSGSVIVITPQAIGPDKRAKVSRALRETGREVALVDAGAFLWIASKGHGQYDNTMATLLPYVTSNPYHPDVSGLVPESMFYGRRSELQDLVRPQGSCYVFGGRQLGKSALLRAAERRFDDDDAHRAIYLDLKGKQIGRPRPPEAIWQELWRSLEAVGIVIGQAPTARIEDRVAKDVSSWLQEDLSRSLLILLDECDFMLEADAKNSLATTGALKSLMEATGRRCKIVFAGLHTVQRFSSVENTPLAHLGAPIAVGPLSGKDAAALVTQPMAALGYQFESDNLVSRILAHTNNQPALLVIFMHHLLDRMNERRQWIPGEPNVVTSSDVDDTWSDPTVEDAIRSRVSLTLGLDPAYEVITYVVAWLVNGGAMDTVPAADLLENCKYFWPKGFRQMTHESFRLLADELIGLGVLARTPQGYRLRSPNVTRLLGTPDEVVQRLEDAEFKEPSQAFEPSQWRRGLAEESASSERSPLSDAEMDDLIRRTTQARIVVGSDALGLSRLSMALEYRLGEGERNKFTESRLSTDPKVVSVLQPLGNNKHRVSLVELVDTPASDMKLLDQVVAAVHPERQRKKGSGTFGAVLSAGPERAPLLRLIASNPQLNDAVPVVPLQPWSSAALQGWGEAAGLPFGVADSARSLAQHTGGWDLLVNEAVAAMRSGSLNTGLNAVDRIVAEPGVLETAVGVFDGDELLQQSWEIAAELAAEPVDIDGLAELMFDEKALSSTLISEMRKGQEVTPRALVLTLVWFGALRVSLDDANLVFAEPVLLRSRAARLS